MPMTLPAAPPEAPLEARPTTPPAATRAPLPAGAATPVLDGPLAPALFKVINGRPTPEELAAVAALIAALTAAHHGPARATADRAAPWQPSGLLPPASWQAGG
ncbi:acyl-CoA carboxylase epsilon subunit [Streptomyces sp. NPDC001568]|uniref:acyl-CoA carboxylase epsilon subunit n=1 Tax=Streptomyces sp. NPDC001568 TaxID=3364588 RepID=UPI0036807D1F